VNQCSTDYHSIFGLEKKRSIALFLPLFLWKENQGTEIDFKCI
jgi:hypothetical protein